MNKSVLAKVSKPLVLRAETAADLMTTNPISIRETATVKEAVAFLTDKGFRAAPVVDVAGRPVGVLSQTDIVVHDRNKVEYVPSATDYYAKADLTAPSGEILPEGFQVENVDRTLVRDIMTPAVLSVPPGESVIRAVGEMVAFKIHRLFVVDEDGILVGVLSAFDVLRNLRVEE
jgi:CBS-domain-containing membrane protein